MPPGPHPGPNATADRTAYDAARAEKASNRRYVRTHLGLIPLNRIQSAAVAESHGIPMEPRPPVVYGMNMQGRRATRGVPLDSPTVHPDPAPRLIRGQRCSWAAMLVYIRGASGSKKTKNNPSDQRIGFLTHIFTYAFGVDNPESLTDVRPYFEDTGRMFAAIEAYRTRTRRWDPRTQQWNEVGSMPSHNSRLSNFRHAAAIVQKWTALNLDDNVKTAYATEYKRLNAPVLAANEVEERAEARRARVAAGEAGEEEDEEEEETEATHIMEWYVIKNAFKVKFGVGSWQYLYILMYGDGPTRDDCGALKVVATRAAMLKDSDWSDNDANYCVLSNASYHGMCTLTLNDYKTVGNRGTVTKPMSDETKAAIIAYRATRGNPLPYLFTQVRDQTKAHGAFSADIGAALDSALPELIGRRVGSIDFLRRSWRSTMAIKSMDGPGKSDSPELMDHSEKMHNSSTYLRTFKARLNGKGPAQPRASSDGAGPSNARARGARAAPAPDDSESESSDSENEEKPPPSRRGRPAAARGGRGGRGGRGRGRGRGRG